ncbi:hypothetical protein DBB29_00835 [Pandoraea cepalis]|uniref:Bacterial type II secretion system protein E domain-containing protein n=1 Tax=Pandoraea cepalis TaxID=2508294 RepID=A0AAW7MH23_9BURK|nr:ATPase, T2SS/T4P/T4SS family [Pandoraea cepalis]MDN4572028.1 hypothetical protein [Pandoraea cepalis]MDN4576679.1 hypothetical protein [Pandoraea cepalis]
MSIFDHSFRDLMLGGDFSEVSRLDGTDFRQTVPPEYRDEVASIRGDLAKVLERDGEHEFTYRLPNGKFMRVTVVSHVHGGLTFWLRDPGPRRTFRDLLLPDPTKTAIMNRDLVGGVLIAGKMGQGKSATMRSALVARCEEFGRLVYLAEDPQEADLDGQYGSGRIIQVPVATNGGGYASALKRGLRTGADELAVGEIRDGACAYEAMQSAMNGNTLFATIHGESISKAIERTVILAATHTENAAAIVAHALSAVLWQELRPAPGPHGEPAQLRLVSRFLIIQDNPNIQANIKASRFEAIAQFVDDQRTQGLYGQAI